MNQESAFQNQKPGRIIAANVAISFALALLLWLVFSWPLPRHLMKAIPYAASHDADSSRIVQMEPGDHLQLLYHFWLLEDMIAGRTPWFHNLYEFNLGDDAARRETGTYYFPFSLFFAAGDRIAGRAFGWNFASFLSLWLTIALTYALLRRYRTPEFWAWVVCLVATALPFRWYNLIGGSPAGFAMCWPPMLMLGLDMAVREDRWRGGVIAGLALLLSAWGDTHVFFFSALLCPCWCAVAFVLREDFSWKKFAGWFRIALALLPVIAGVGIALLTTRNMTGNVEHSGMKQRPDREVLLSSPDARGLFSWDDLGLTNHVYLGVCLLALLLAGFVAALIIWLRRREGGRRVLALAMIALGITGIVLLALGLRGWHAGYVFRQARHFIPHYGMIRQCGKIFCLMPSIFAVAAALSIQSILAASRNRRLAGAFCAMLLLGAVAEYRAQYVTRLCSLIGKQNAYAQIAADAKSRDSKPHALVIPFWPGDSHFASVYQFYCSLYRIRMVNGYRPFVPATYRIDYFRSIASANEGELSDAQLDDLQERGVNYIVLHEDLFPEKVSPRPVAWTLKQLLNHPRLRLLAHDGTAWSWRIEREPHAVEPSGTSWTTWFPTQKTREVFAADFTNGAVTWPAPIFFHRGSVNLTNDSVALEPERDSPNIALYGPRLVVAPGTYEFTVDFTTPATDAKLGHWAVESPEGQRIAWLQMQAGRPFTYPVTIDATNARLLLIFAYDSAAPVEIKSVSLRRR